MQNRDRISDVSNKPLPEVTKEAGSQLESLHLPPSSEKKGLNDGFVSAMDQPITSHETLVKQLQIADSMYDNSHGKEKAIILYEKILMELGGTKVKELERILEGDLNSVGRLCTQVRKLLDLKFSAENESECERLLKATIHILNCTQKVGQENETELLKVWKCLYGSKEREKNSPDKKILAIDRKIANGCLAYVKGDTEETLTPRAAILMELYYIHVLDKGEYNDALARITEAAQIVQMLIPRHSRENEQQEALGLVLREKGNLEYEMGDINSATVSMERAHRCLAKSVGPYSEETLYAEISLGRFYRETERFEDSISVLKESLRKIEKIKEKNSKDTDFTDLECLTLVELGNSYYATGMFCEEGKSLLDEAAVGIIKILHKREDDKDQSSQPLETLLEIFMTKAVYAANEGNWTEEKMMYTEAIRYWLEYGAPTKRSIDMFMHIVWSTIDVFKAKEEFKSVLKIIKLAINVISDIEKKDKGEEIKLLLLELCVREQEERMEYLFYPESDEILEEEGISEIREELELLFTKSMKIKDIRLQLLIKLQSGRTELLRDKLGLDPEALQFAVDEIMTADKKLDEWERCFVDSRVTALLELRAALCGYQGFEIEEGGAGRDTQELEYGEHEIIKEIDRRVEKLNKER